MAIGYLRTAIPGQSKSACNPSAEYYSQAMNVRQKLAVHEGFTQLQEMRLEMLRTVLWRILFFPLTLVCGLALGAVALAWFFIGFVSPLLGLGH